MEAFIILNLPLPLFSKEGIAHFVRKGGLSIMERARIK
jgi:hypothetical protein